MKNVRAKLRSQRGASILLALLFLLVCMLAAASVLMAAVSNAGKIQSNYQEQQRYLALSSALRLVAEELERAEYRGWYTVKTWTETRTVTRPDGSKITFSTNYYSVQQDLGAFSCGHLSKLDGDGKTPTNGGTPLNQEVLTFRRELDGLFAREFTGTGWKPLSGDQIASLPTNPGDGSTPATRILTVSVTGDEELAKQLGPVTVEADMGQNLRIHLKATLEPDGAGGPAYVMEAELAPSDNIDFTVNYPGNRLPKNEPGGGGVDVVGNSEKSDKTEPVTWRLDWITRQTGEEVDGG